MDKKQLKEIKRFTVILFVVLIIAIQWNFVITAIPIILNILSPLLVGVVIAFLLNRIMILFEKLFTHLFAEKLPKKFKRVASIVLAYISLILVLTVIINIIVPELIISIERLTKNFGSYWLNSEEYIKSILSMFGVSMEDTSAIDVLLGTDFADWSQIASRVFDFISQQMSKFVPNLFSFTTNFISNVLTFFIAIFISFYLLVDKEKILNVFKKMIILYSNDKIYQRAEYVGKVIVDTFNKYVVGQLIEACILGTLCFIGMRIFRFEYSLLISVLVGITALIPILGAYIGGGISFFLLFLISPLNAFLFLVFLVILQQFENNFIYPFVVGSSIGLPPLLVLLSIIIGGAAFGLFGMILAVPVAAVVYTLIRNDMTKREAHQLDKQKSKKQK